MDAGKFLAGLCVLAVDDDRISLMILEKQLKHCNYNGEHSRLLGCPCKISPRFCFDGISERFFLLLEFLWCRAVTTVTDAKKALDMIRERKDGDQFSLVICDVVMPDIDGFKLLELIGLEMDMPVISKAPAQIHSLPF